MKILILTSGNVNKADTIETQLRDELTQHSHEVFVLDVEAMEKNKELIENCHMPKQGVLRKLFADHQLHRIKHILAPALRDYLHNQQYDAIVPTTTYAAAVVSVLQQAQDKPSAYTVLVSAEYDSLPRKESLSCDDYIVMNKAAISTLVDWGVNAARIHYFDVSDHVIHDICNLLESLVLQWLEMERKLSSERWL